MSDKQEIVIINLKEGTIDSYKDLIQVADHLNSPKSWVRSILKNGMGYIDGMFFGYSTIHKSGRGSNNG